MKSRARTRRATRADDVAVAEVVAAAFGPAKGPQVAGLVEALERAGHVRHSLVAEVEGVVVGHVQLNHSWLDARPRLVDVLVLSPLSVAPSFQGEGIGGDLVAAAVDAARGTDLPALFLEGSPAYYGARGFVRASDHGFVRPSPRIPDAAFQVVPLPSHEPWMTGPLVYCDPFWVHDCVGLRDPGLADLEERLA